MAHAAYPAKPKLRGILDAILLLAVLAATVNLLLPTPFHSFLCSFIWPALFGPQPYELTMWHRVDQAILSAVPAEENGNIAARLPDANSAENKYFVPAFYYRAVYILWPRRFYIADPRVVIATDQQLAAAEFPTDPQWLMQHNIRAVVSYHLKDGQLTIERLSLNQAAPP